MVTHSEPVTASPPAKTTPRRTRTTSGKPQAGSLEQAIVLRDRLRAELSAAKELIRTLKSQMDVRRAVQ